MGEGAPLTLDLLLEDEGLPPELPDIGGAGAALERAAVAAPVPGLPSLPPLPLLQAEAAPKRAAEGSQGGRAKRAAAAAPEIRRPAMDSAALRRIGDAISAYLAMPEDERVGVEQRAPPPVAPAGGAWVPTRR